MAPYDFDEANPGDSDVVANFPSNERDARSAVHDAYEEEHYEATGYHRMPYGDDADRGTHFASPADGNVFFNEDGSIQIYDSGAWISFYRAFTGQMTCAAFDPSSPPDGWLNCDGSAVSRTTYAALFAVIGETFGVGDGSTTFNLPDMKQKFVAGYDSGDAEYDEIGETGGSETVTLTSSEVPALTTSSDSTGITLGASTSNSAATTAGAPFLSFARSTHSHTVNESPHDHTVNSGSADPHENRPPFIVLAWLIKT